MPSYSSSGGNITVPSCEVRVDMFKFQANIQNMYVRIKSEREKVQ